MSTPGSCPWSPQQNRRCPPERAEPQALFSLGVVRRKPALSAAEGVERPRLCAFRRNAFNLHLEVSVDRKPLKQKTIPAIAPAASPLKKARFSEVKLQTASNQRRINYLREHSPGRYSISIPVKLPGSAKKPSRIKEFYRSLPPAHATVVPAASLSSVPGSPPSPGHRTAQRWLAPSLAEKRGPTAFTPRQAARPVPRLRACCPLRPRPAPAPGGGW